MLASTEGCVALIDLTNVYPFASVSGTISDVISAFSPFAARPPETRNLLTSIGGWL